jgi:hypothetical protein
MEELEQDEPQSAPEQLSVDQMARVLVPRRVETEERRILLAFLGLDNDGNGDAWLGQQDLAERLAVSRETIQHVLHRTRKRWSRQPWMTILRQEVAT